MHGTDMNTNKYSPADSTQTEEQVVVTIHSAWPHREDKLQSSSLVLPPPPSTVLPAICRRPVAKFGTHNEARSCSTTMQIVTVRTKQNRFCVFFVFFLSYELPHCFFCNAPYFPIACFFNGNRPQKHSLLTSFFFMWSCWIVYG